MNVLRSFFFSLRKLVSPGASSSELDAELQFHMDMSVEQKLAAGMNREQAEREARKEFGSDLRVKEDCRMNWGTRLVDETVQDVRRGFRRLCKRPAYSVPVMVILGVSLAVCGTFSDILWQRILHPVDYPKADEILEIAVSHPMEQQFSWVFQPPSSTVFDCISENKEWFESIGQIFAEGFFLRIGDKTEHIVAAMMTPSCWEVMKVVPRYGRVFSEHDIEDGDGLVAVVTHHFARERFGKASAALGERISLSGKKYDIVGVLGAGVDFIGYNQQITIPFDSRLPDQNEGTQGKMGRVLCRLRQDFNRDQLLARLPGLWEPIKGREPDKAWYFDRYNIHFKVRRLVDTFKSDFDNLSFGKLVWLLSVLSFLLFLTACMNWLIVFRTNLIRSMRNVGICYALGAPQRRMLSSAWIENMSLLGGSLLFGILGSLALHRMINTWSLFESSPVVNDVVGLLTMVGLFGLGLLMGFPFIHQFLINRNVQKYLFSRQSTHSLRSKSLFSLSLAQSFLGTILLLVSIFLGINIHRVLNTDFGFDFEERLVAVLHLPTWKKEYSHVEKLQLLRELKENLRRDPTFETVSVGYTLPQSTLWYGSASLSVDGSKFPYTEVSKPKLDPRGSVYLSVNYVDSSFDDALNLKLLAGRWFESQDELTEEQEVIIDETAAKTLFGDTSPIGFQYVRNTQDGEIVDRYRIIGVVKDVSYEILKVNYGFDRFQTYQYYGESDDDLSFLYDYNLVCKLRDSESGGFQHAFKVIKDLDSDIGFKMKSYREDLRASYGTQWLMSKVAVGMSVITVLVAGYGFFSFLYFKSQLMKKEYAIRLSLGARKGRMILGYMLRQSFPVLIGTLMGIVSVYYSLGIVGHYLTDVSRSELLPYGILVVGVIGFLCASSVFPIWQMRKLELREMLQGE